MDSTGTDTRDNTKGKRVLVVDGGRIWVLTEARSQMYQCGGSSSEDRKSNFVYKHSSTTEIAQSNAVLQKVRQTALIIPHPCVNRIPQCRSS